MLSGGLLWSCTPVVSRTQSENRLGGAGAGAESLRLWPVCSLTRAVVSGLLTDPVSGVLEPPFQGGSLMASVPWSWHCAFNQCFIMWNRAGRGGAQLKSQ